MFRVNPSARRHCNMFESSRNYRYWIANFYVDEIRILYKKYE